MPSLSACSHLSSATYTGSPHTDSCEQTTGPLALSLYTVYVPAVEPTTRLRALGTISTNSLRTDCSPSADETARLQLLQTQKNEETRVRYVRALGAANAHPPSLQAATSVGRKTARSLSHSAKAGFSNLPLTKQKGPNNQQDRAVCPSSYSLSAAPTLSHIQGRGSLKF